MTEPSLLLIDDGSTVELDAIARGCGVDPAWVLDLVDAGILQPLPDANPACFDAASLFTARSVQRLQRDLGLNLDGAALVLELLERNRCLREQLLRSGERPQA